MDSYNQLYYAQNGEHSSEGLYSGDSSTESRSKAVCRYFNIGRCTWAEKCRFLHPSAERFDKIWEDNFERSRPESRKNSDKNSLTRSALKEFERSLEDPPSKEDIADEWILNRTKRNLPLLDGRPSTSSCTSSGKRSRSCSTCSSSDFRSDDREVKKPSKKYRRRSPSPRSEDYYKETRSYRNRSPLPQSEDYYKETRSYRNRSLAVASKASYKKKFKSRRQSPKYKRSTAKSSSNERYESKHSYEYESSETREKLSKSRYHHITPSPMYEDAYTKESSIDNYASKNSSSRKRTSSDDSLDERDCKRFKGKSSSGSKKEQILKRLRAVEDTIQRELLKV